MANLLDHLAPTLVWRHFEALSAIPRASGNEEAARQYVLAQAARLGLETVSDRVGNIVVRKPARAGREGAVPAVLQGHLDMVCEKNEGTAHNFDTDPIRLVLDGDWLRADGTTLGADNGVGAAAALAVMDSEDVAQGPLEFLFTVDEETGLTGASEFPAGLLRARYLLNLDGEEEGTLCIGCAGGLNTVARREVAWQTAGVGDGWRIKVSGLQGGHSGIDIHRGRGNAIRILGRVLETLMRGMPVGRGRWRAAASAMRFRARRRRRWWWSVRMRACARGGERDRGGSAERVGGFRPGTADRAGSGGAAGDGDGG